MTEKAPASVARGFLFADVRGYSAWVERHGDHAAVGLLREYRTVVRQAVGEFDGSEIKTEGDSFYVAFGSPSAAVRCGLRILEMAAANEGGETGPIAVGIGVHAGETASTDEGYVGSAVNVAARVCAQAGAGELLATDAVRAMTRTFLEVSFTPRGRKRLKGISEPIALYRVTPAGAPAAAPRRPQLTRRWLVAAAALGIVVVLASAILGGALIRESVGQAMSPTPSPAPSVGTLPSPLLSPSATPLAGFPTADETELLELVDADDRRHCDRAAYQDRPILAYTIARDFPTANIRNEYRAAIVCDLGGFDAPDDLWLWQLTERFDAVGDPARSSIAAIAGRIGATPGSCREKRPTFDTWEFGGSSGDLLCFETDEGDAVLIWVYNDDEERYLFARALRDDRDMDALLDWWEDVGRYFAP